MRRSSPKRAAKQRATYLDSHGIDIDEVRTMKSDVEYRSIAGVEGYKIGSDGTVWSCRIRKPSPDGRGSISGVSDKWHEVKPWPTSKYGYLAVSLQTTDGGRIVRKVYRLVLEAFIGPAPNGCHACHNDGNTGNNKLSNLRWDTVKNNHADKKAHGTHLCGSRVPIAKINEDTARRIKQMMAGGARNCEIIRSLDVTSAIVEKIRAGTAWRHVSA